jgi:hypothetical protein
MQIKELIERAFTNAVGKGWHDKPATFGELIALCHSEVSEAWAEDIAMGVYFNKGNPKPEGFAVELIDVCIRIFDMAGKFEIELFPFALCLSIPVRYDKDYFCCRIHQLLSDTLELYRVGVKPHGKNEITEKLSEIIAFIDIGLTQYYETNVDEVIELKMNYNETRPYRHGGKKL